MVSFSQSVKFLLLPIATWGMVAPSAIARPVVSVPSLSSYQINRINRDLTRSPAEDFFREGRLKLEREIQLARKQQQLTKDVLKVNPDSQIPEEFTPEQNSKFNRVSK